MGKGKPEISEEERKRQEEELERRVEEERKVREEEERIRKEKEQEMREEMFRLIREEEDRLRKREEMMKAREREYSKKKRDIFELAFDDELADVRKLVGISDKNGAIQRNCAATPPGALLCACMTDPFFNGPTYAAQPDPYATRPVPQPTSSPSHFSSYILMGVHAARYPANRQSRARCIRSAETHVEVYAANENDVTPLSEAAVGGATEVITELLRHGAARVIDLPDSHGRTPIFRAAFMGKPATVEILMKYGADATIKNKENECPHDVTADEAIRALLNAYTAEHMMAAREAVETAASASWQPPPPEPDPADLVPRTQYRYTHTLFTGGCSLFGTGMVALVLAARYVALTRRQVCGSHSPRLASWSNTPCCPSYPLLSRMLVVECLLAAAAAASAPMYHMCNHGKIIHIDPPPSA